jgi:hypothetical protein
VNLDLEDRLDLESVKNYLKQGIKGPEGIEKWASSVPVAHLTYLTKYAESAIEAIDSFIKKLEEK